MRLVVSQTVCMQFYVLAFPMLTLLLASLVKVMSKLSEHTGS